MLICILFSTTVHAQGETLDTNKDEIYEKVLEAYRKGDKMSEEVVTARKQAAEQLGLEAFWTKELFCQLIIGMSRRLERMEQSKIQRWTF